VQQAVVIGAGPGGLAAAAMLRARGVDALVVDRADTIGDSWRHHYDRLHLHTVRWLSHLPGYHIPRRYGKWVARDDVVRYLGEYAAHHRLPVQLGTPVTRVDRTADGWSLRSPVGDVDAAAVVVATGHNHTPRQPDWPGVDGFAGELLHASRYRNPAPFAGKSVLVVGSGNTGAEIAVDLVEGGAREVAIAIRTPPHIVLRENHGIPSLALGVLFRHLPARLFDPIAAAMRRVDLGDLSAYGLPTPKDGLYERVLRDDQIPVIDVGFVNAVKNGQITVVPGVVGFDGRYVCLDGGLDRPADVVIAATGYERGLGPLVGHLGVLDGDGRPTVRRGQTHPAAPRVWFTGYTNPISGMFRELGIDARHIARAAAGEIGDAGASRSRLRRLTGPGTSALASRRKRAQPHDGRPLSPYARDGSPRDRSTARTR
jgi:putative flavoprotein involved in K+ transport